MNTKSIDKRKKRREKRAERIAKKQAEQLDMREYIQFHLDLYGMGKLDRIKGPMRGGRHNDQSWYQLTLIYRPEVDGHHFDDQYIEVYLGYRQEGGYWNRRNIRVAIEKRAKAEREQRRETEAVERVWRRSQLAITDGRNTASGAIEL
jgi:hypothetical protein